MNKDFISTESQTDWDRIDAMRDEDIDLSDIPEITAAQFARATLRMGGKRIPKGKILVLLDADVVARLREMAGEEEYPALVNAILRTNLHETTFERLLRRVIREELAAVR